MCAERVSSKGLAVRGVAALIMLAIILFLFSTGLYIRVPLGYGFHLGDLVIVTLVMLFIVKAEQLVAPLSSVVSLALEAESRVVGSIIQAVLRLLEIAVAYYTLRRVFNLLAVPIIGLENSYIVYDAVFLVAACLTIYNLVKSLAR
uniref:Uncharacterized protein n=1 Tax=Thermofilum pendens TaxID=2269 RepID=A0A7C1T2N3_THEPE